MKTIKRIYKNKTYTLTLRNGDLVYAMDSEGYHVVNPIIYQALIFLI